MLMKERYKSWRNLSAKAPKNSEPNAMMVIRDIPEFSNLENDLVLETKVYRLSGTLHQAKIDKLSKKIFGITAAETEFIVPENYNSLREGSHEKNTINNAFWKHKKSYSTAEVSDEEAVNILLDLLFDFRDINGYPLRLTQLFKRQAEAVAKGIAGKMNSRNEVDLDTLQVKLQHDADKFIASRKR